MSVARFLPFVIKGQLEWTSEVDSLCALSRPHRKSQNQTRKNPATDN